MEDPVMWSKGKDKKKGTGDKENKAVKYKL